MRLLVPGCRLDIHYRKRVDGMVGWGGGGEIARFTQPITTILSNATQHYPSSRRGIRTYFTQPASNACSTSIIRVYMVTLQRARVSLGKRFWKEQNCWILPDRSSVGVVEHDILGIDFYSYNLFITQRFEIRCVTKIP